MADQDPDLHPDYDPNALTAFIQMLEQNHNRLFVSDTLDGAMHELLAGIGEVTELQYALVTQTATGNKINATGRDNRAFGLMQLVMGVIRALVEHHAYEDSYVLTSYQLEALAQIAEQYYPQEPSTRIEVPDLKLN